MHWKAANDYFYQKQDPHIALEEVKTFHYNIMKDLFKNETHGVYQDVNNFFVEADGFWKKNPSPL